MIPAVLVLSFIFSLVSTAILAYIATAAAIGPWIEPTIGLIALVVFTALRYSGANKSRAVALVTMAGSIGGIMATGVGFSFPTLYFLQPHFFSELTASPVRFISLVSSLSAVAGLFGFVLADFLEYSLVIKEGLSFPIGELVHSMVGAAGAQIKKAYELFTGVALTLAFCGLQEGVWFLPRLIPYQVTVFSAVGSGAFIIPAVVVRLWPMVWSVGFIAGHLIAVPLAVGALANSVVLHPLRHMFFPLVPATSFVFAFCGGMVLSGVIISFIGMPRALCTGVRGLFARTQPKTTHTTSVITWLQNNPFRLALLVVAFVASFVFFSYNGFSLLAQVYILLFTAIWTYEAAYQGGKLGLATLGRFATFVMLPAMLLFQLTTLQIVIIATFVEVCAGVAVDVLFGRKLAQLEQIKRLHARLYQLFGLVVSALSVGALFWVLISFVPLGSADLFALKAQNRAALISVTSFNYWVLVIGVLFGFLLKKVKINPSLVLGGILMPLHLSLGLIIGGLATRCVHDKQAWYPFWSGVFVANSLWIVLKAAFSLM